MSSREKLLDSAVEVFIERGFGRSSVDEICRRAGTTKGAFFHHFRNKEEVGLLALQRFGKWIVDTFAIGYQKRPDEPVGRLFDYIDHVVDLGEHTEPMPCCLVAVLTLELGAANPKFRNEANKIFVGWLDDLEKLFSEAISSVAAPIDRTPRQLAEYLLATMEGSLIMTRAQKDRSPIHRNLGMFRSQLTTLLTP